jgi:hypothetical protein
MKISVAGRPGIVLQRGATVVTTLVSRNSPALPRELPEVPMGAVPYTIMIPAKQWARVSDQLQNPQARLVVDGYCAYDPAFKGMVIFAQAVATRLPPPPKPTPQYEAPPPPPNFEGEFE